MAGLIMTSMTTTADDAGPLYRERRRVPVWWWAVALVIAVPSFEIVTVFAPEMTSHGGWLLATGVAIVTVALVAAFLMSLSRSDVAVDAAGLRVDRQLLPAAAIGRVRVLGELTMRDVLGRDARADAVLSIRPWLHTGVQIEVVDAADPTPYWVVATRRPAELANVLSTLALRAAGDEPGGSR
jgi:DUF3093 family protein